MRNTAILGLLPALFLSGCAIHDGRPAVSTLDVPSQTKLKSASHWQVVATDVATQIDASLKQNNQAGTPIWVPAGNPGSAFSKVFASQLQSSLMQRGLSVVDQQGGALEVSVTTEAVWHGADRHVYRPGTYTALTAGVLVLRDAVLHHANPVGPIMGAAVALDVARTVEEFSGRPFTEIVLTTSVKKGSAFVMHRTDVYYVDEVDAALFDIRQREFKVVGQKS